LEKQGSADQELGILIKPKEQRRRRKEMMQSIVRG